MAFDDPTHRPSPTAGHSAVPGRVDWQAAMAEHRRWLRTVVIARIGDADAADEVLQEVALAAIEHGNRLRDSTKLAPWLYRIAVATALQYRRRQGRRRKLVIRFAVRVPPTDCDDREPDPLDWLVAAEQRTLVRRALDGMPRRDAEILLLKYAENWSYRQLAQHLGLSTSAVEARLHRARHKLRRRLAVLDPSLAATAG